MSNVLKEMSVAELERALNLKKSRLDELTSRRAKLQEELDAVEAKIRDLAGRGNGSDSHVRRRRRPKNAKPLKHFVIEVLTKNKKGLSLAELHEKVAESGYKTKSRNFKNVLYQCVYNSDNIVHDKQTGKYQLQS